MIYNLVISVFYFNDTLQCRSQSNSNIFSYVILSVIYVCVHVNRTSSHKAPNKYNFKLTGNMKKSV